jgi:hypothetical protein
MEKLQGQRATISILRQISRSQFGSISVHSLWHEISHRGGMKKNFLAWMFCFAWLGAFAQIEMPDGRLRICWGK